MVSTKLLSWVKRGVQRKAVLKAIEPMMTPAEIHKAAKKFNPKLSLNNTSDILRGFVKVKIAICVNPKETHGRLYKITKKGQEIKKFL